jgi:hypothetical protein
LQRRSTLSRNGKRGQRAYPIVARVRSGSRAPFAAGVSVVKKTFALAGALMALLIPAPALAADHGYVAGAMTDDPANSTYRVNIEKINGKEVTPRPNHDIPVGRNEVTVSLVYDAAWGSKFSHAEDVVFQATFTLDVEAGKTYVIGAKVDTSAPESALADGSFWSPVVVEVR